MVSVPPSGKWPCKVQCKESIKDHWRSSPWAALMPTRINLMCVGCLICLLCELSHCTQLGVIVRAGTENGLNDSEGEADTSLIFLLFFLVVCVWYRQFGFSLPKCLKMCGLNRTMRIQFLHICSLWWARVVAALVSTHFTFYMFIRFPTTYNLHKCKV